MPIGTVFNSGVEGFNRASQGIEKASAELKPRSGRYGYFVTCGECDTNTPMKTSCPQCSSANTKVSKRKELYSLVCDNCDSCLKNSVVFFQTIYRSI